MISAIFPKYMTFPGLENVFSNSMTFHGCVKPDREKTGFLENENINEINMFHKTITLTWIKKMFTSVRATELSRYGSLTIHGLDDTT